MPETFKKEAESEGEDVGSGERDCQSLVVEAASKQMEYEIQTDKQTDKQTGRPWGRQATRHTGLLLGMDST